MIYPVGDTNVVKVKPVPLNEYRIFVRVSGQAKGVTGSTWYLSWVVWAKDEDDAYEKSKDLDFIPTVTRKETYIMPREQVKEYASDD